MCFNCCCEVVVGCRFILSCWCAASGVPLMCCQWCVVMLSPAQAGCCAIILRTYLYTRRACILVLSVCIGWLLRYHPRISHQPTCTSTHELLTLSGCCIEVDCCKWNVFGGIDGYVGWLLTLSGRCFLGEVIKEGRGDFYRCCWTL